MPFDEHGVQFEKHVWKYWPIGRSIAIKNYIEKSVYERKESAFKWIS